MNLDLQNITPLENESPACFAGRLGELYTSTVSSQLKKENGQFFTPLGIARFMSKQIADNQSSVSILDPGCGTAILSCALIEKLSQSGKLKEVRLVTYEIDLVLCPVTKIIIEYLKEWLYKQNIFFSYVIHNSDFVLDNYLYLNNHLYQAEEQTTKFDFIISNPPYFKLSKEDKRVKAAQCIIDGQPNIYSIFMAICSRLLKPSGELIFIVPRSFTSGRYFRLFRSYFFDKVKIEFIHLFNTRKDTFSKDNVLQETLIIKCTNKEVNATTGDNPVIISYSEGIKDLDFASKKKFAQKDLIDLNSIEKILHLPVNIREEAIIKLFKSWSGSLNKYNIQISTGPVVAFRTKENISENKEDNIAPLFWLHNVVKMLIDHPVIKEGKGQYIRISKDTISSLIPNKNYIFLRRFSSKDDSSRLIAAPYFCNMSSATYIGVENKLNYIYRPKGHLDRTEVMGIAALLNSNLFDTYFRTFNGNVNVSATELREMPMPPLETIKAIGEQLILMNNFSLDNVSVIVNKFFHV